MTKGPDAFRTISEVAEWLEVPTHVLRFWESRFTQVKPVKRAGGRRYYRPADMQLLGGIKRLLHDDGLTIRGVQKLLREEGARHVSALSPPIDGEAWGPEQAKVIALDPGRTADTDEAADAFAADPGADEVAYLSEVGADERPMASTNESRDRLEEENDGSPVEAEAYGEPDTPSPAPETAFDTEQTETPARDVPDHTPLAAAAPEAPTEETPAETAPSAPEVPVFDETEVVPRPLVLAPLATIRRTTRVRWAHVHPSAIAEAQALAHAWDART